MTVLKHNEDMPSEPSATYEESKQNNHTQKIITEKRFN